MPEHSRKTLTDTYGVLLANKGKICPKNLLMANNPIDNHYLRVIIDRIREHLGNSEMVYVLHSEGYVLTDKPEEKSFLYFPPTHSIYNLEFLSEKDQRFIYECEVNETKLKRRFQSSEVAMVALLGELSSLDPESFIPTREISTAFYRCKDQTVRSALRKIKEKLGGSVSFCIQSKAKEGYRLVVADGIEPSTFPM